MITTTIPPAAVNVKTPLRMLTIEGFLLGIILCFLTTTFIFIIIILIFNHWTIGSPCKGQQEAGDGYG